MNKQAIGFFDSGVGGLSIWKEVTTLLPNEDTIYLADSLNAPYGEKSKEQILALCIKNTEKLIALGCKLIVVACNTATTNAISYLRNTYPIPFIGIEPAIKPASIKSKTKTIGILATKGTLNSELFAATSKKYLQNTTVIETQGKGLVPLIEADKIATEEMQTLLKSYITPMLEKNIDYLVLGCSHYPFLIPAIKKISEDITIIDSGEAVARQTKVVLENNNLETPLVAKPGNHQIITNGKVAIVQNLPLAFSNNTIFKKEKF